MSSIARVKHFAKENIKEFKTIINARKGVVDPHIKFFQILLSI